MFTNNSDSQEELKEDNISPDLSRFTSKLAGYLVKEFERAYQHKLPILDRYMLALQDYNIQYTSDKLAAIKKLGGSDIYESVTRVKVNDAVNYMADIMCNRATRIWGIEATPLPDALYDSDMQGLQDRIDTLVALQQKIIEEQLLECSYDDVLLLVIVDFVLYGIGIIKAPVLQRRKKLGIKNNSITVVEEVAPIVKRVSPFDFFPEPLINNIDSGYIFEKNSIKPYELKHFIGVAGYSEQYIDKVLDTYPDGYDINQSKRIYGEQVLGKAIKTEGSSETKTGLLDLLEFHGHIKGDMLIDWGIDDSENINSDDFYCVRAILIGEFVVYLTLEYDLLERKPYAVCRYDIVSNSIEGYGLADILRPIQTAYNAAMRALVNNIGLASAPQVERNIDRISGQTKEIAPWKVWDATDVQMSGSPALRFYQPDMNVNQILSAVNTLLDHADNISGIPRYIAGSAGGGGAMSTASGLSMLMQQGSRTLQRKITNVDNAIETVIKMFYTYNVMFEDLVYIPDLQINAFGAAILSKKTENLKKYYELIGLVQAPAILNIIKDTGLAKVLIEYLNILEIKADGIVPTPQQLQQQQQMIQMVMQLQQMIQGLQPQGQNPTPQIQQILQFVAQLGQTIQSGQAGQEQQSIGYDAIKQASPLAYNAMTGGSLPNPQSNDQNYHQYDGRMNEIAIGA